MIPASIVSFLTELSVMQTQTSMATVIWSVYRWTLILNTPPSVSVIILIVTLWKFLCISFRHHLYFNSTGPRSSNSVFLFGLSIISVSCFSCCAQCWFSVSRQTFLHSSSSIVQSLNPPRTWMLEPPVRWVFIYSSVWSVSTQSHPADQWLFHPVCSRLPRVKWSLHCPLSILLPT